MTSPTPDERVQEARRLADVLRIAQQYSNEHGEDMIRASNMLEALAAMPTPAVGREDIAKIVHGFSNNGDIDWENLSNLDGHDLCKAHYLRAADTILDAMRGGQALIPVGSPVTYRNEEAGLFATVKGHVEGWYEILLADESIAIVRPSRVFLSTAPGGSDAP